MTNDEIAKITEQLRRNQQTTDYLCDALRLQTACLMLIADGASKDSRK